MAETDFQSDYEAIKGIHTEVLYASALTQNATNLLQEGNFDDAFHLCLKKEEARKAGIALYIVLHSDPNFNYQSEVLDSSTLSMDMRSLQMPRCNHIKPLEMFFYFPEHIPGIVEHAQQQPLRSDYMHLLALYVLKPWFFLQQRLTENSNAPQKDKELEFIDYLKASGIAIPELYFQIICDQTFNLILSMPSPQSSDPVDTIKRNDRISKMLVERHSLLKTYLNQ